MTSRTVPPTSLNLFLAETVAITASVFKNGDRRKHRGHSADCKQQPNALLISAKQQSQQEAIKHSPRAAIRDDPTRPEQSKFTGRNSKSIFAKLRHSKWEYWLQTPAPFHSSVDNPSLAFRDRPVLHVHVYGKGYRRRTVQLLLSFRVDRGKFTEIQHQFQCNYILRVIISLEGNYLNLLASMKRHGPSWDDDVPLRYVLGAVEERSSFANHQNDAVTM